MRVYIDTNILLDYLLPERERYEEAITIFEMGKEGLIELYLSSQSMLDALYSARKSPHFPRIKKALFAISRIVNIVSIGFIETTKALKSGESDLEDVAQILTADGENCDLIITNDKQFPLYPADWPFMRMTSKEFVSNCRALEVI